MSAEVKDGPAAAPVGALVPGACVRLDGAPARVGAPAHPPEAPRVELVRAGDLVRAIDVFCVCGQHVRLHCQYE